MSRGILKRGKQTEYNRLLDAFSGRKKSFSECVNYLLSLDRGISRGQANNAVHVYFKGGSTEAEFRLSSQQRDELLDAFSATKRTPRDCVDYLRNFGCTYRQATSAVYKYRQEKGLIGT